MWRPVYLVYLGYYVKNANYGRLLTSMRWVHEHQHKGYGTLASDILACSIRYSTSFEDYFKYNFAELNATERATYAGAGVMHRFTNQMNDPRYRPIFRSKALFLRHFNHLMGRQSLYLQETTQEDFNGWIAKRPIVVAKPSLGTCGKGIEFIDTTRTEPQNLYSALLHAGQDILEEPIIQHKALQRLNPSSVNTVRIVTVCTGTQVDIIGAVLKLSVGGKCVDNTGSGGIAAPVDPDTGIITKGARKNVVWSPRYEFHPDTHEAILGFQLPFWNAVLEMARQAAAVIPKVRTVGWDIAVTDSGAILVEGNDNWGGPLWQFSPGEGLIAVLRRYADV